MSTTLERKRVPLGKPSGSPFPNRFLVIDRDGDTYRVAYYRTRHPKEEGHYVPEDAWRLGVELGWFPEKGKPTAWVRSAATGHRLLEAVRGALRGVAPVHDDPDGIVDYVRATSWGAGLP